MNTLRKKIHTLLNSLSIHSLLPLILYITMLPHLQVITPVFSIFIIFILGWFFLHTFGIAHLPGRVIRFVLVITALILLIMNFGLFLSQQAFITLLCMTLSLKLLEIKNELDRRNIFLVIFLGYFLLVIHFLHSQDILLGLFALANFIILTILLSAFNRLPQPPLALRANLTFIGQLVLKAIPLAIVLFLFFPRIPGPLWSLPQDGSTATTGIDDKMYPGSVSTLSESDEIAFRIDFHSNLPTPEKLYWRGPVLTETDGFLWSQKKLKRLAIPYEQVVQNQASPVSYTITLEPHRQKWLFTLEMPRQVKGDTIQGFYFNQDLQLINQFNINQLTQYQVTSMTDFKLNRIHQKELQESLQVSGEANPRTRALGEQWRQQFQAHRDIVQQGLDYFKNNPFYYTKLPDVMINNPSDQFLFDKRRGFCEHFASSFVLLMRYAGVPSRVVTGYQGIEENEVGNYYIVRQSNAHAWAEVWLADSGWTRIDPTAMIPPERIEADILDTSIERLDFSSLNLPDLNQLAQSQKTALYHFWKQLNQSLDNIKYTWNNWILGYDQSKQNLFLTLMGLNPDWKTLIMLLVASIMIILISLQLINFYNNYKQIDIIFRHYQKFLNKLNRSGLTISPSDGPEFIKQLAIKNYPQQRNQIISIIDTYLLIRYGNQSSAHLVQQFKQQIRQLKLSLSSRNTVKQ